MRNNKIKLISLLIAISGTCLAQIRLPEFEVHNRGNLWETMQDNGRIGAPQPNDRSEYYPGMDWPGGPAELTHKDEQRSYLYGAGLWIGGYYNDGSLFFNEHGPGGYIDPGSEHTISVKNNFIESADYDTNEAEQTITASWVTSSDIEVTRTSRSWSFSGYNDFIIIEYSLRNLNSDAVNDLYVGLPYLLRPSYQDVSMHNGWGDNITDRSDDLIKYDPDNNLIFSYDTTKQYNWLIGNYSEVQEELRTPGFAGYAFLGSSQSSDASDQPSNTLLTHYLRANLDLSLSYTTEAELYEILNGSDQSLQIAPDSLVVPFGLMSMGPYTIDPGGSVFVTVVEAVNGLPLEECFGPPADMATIQAQYLSVGLDSLRGTIQRAKMLYENDFLFTKYPPPSPPIEVASRASTQSIMISWDPYEATWINPGGTTSNFKEYRIYRSDRSFIGPFGNYLKRIKVWSNLDRNRYYNRPGGEDRWRYEDNSVSLGVGYYYALTVLDSTGRESWLTNRNEYAVKSATLPAEDSLNVNVFPNPFREKSGIPTQGEANTITFTNLPETCNLRIYTTSGELVKNIKRLGSPNGEEVWDQLTDSRQRTAPGIYFWTVDSPIGSDNGTLVLIK